MLKDIITTIIVNYNTNKLTRDVLLTLLESQLPENVEHKIIVVDNGSKEPFKLPRKAVSDDVLLLKSEKNIGFTGGNNLGISYAINKFNTDYIFLLNSDAFVDKDTLKFLYQKAKSDKKIGIVSPKIYFYKNYEFLKGYPRDTKGKIFWYVGGIVDWGNLLSYHQGVDEVDYGQFDYDRELEFATGCAMFLNRHIFDKIKIFDKKYFLYLEDLDLSLRARRAGFKICFEYKAKVWHKNAGSSEGVGSVIQRYYQTRNLFYFFIKYGSMRVKIRTLRYMLYKFFHGKKIEKKAVIDFLIGRMGKQEVI